MGKWNSSNTNKHKKSKAAGAPSPTQTLLEDLLGRVDELQAFQAEWAQRSAALSTALTADVQRALLQVKTDAGQHRAAQQRWNAERNELLAQKRALEARLQWKEQQQQANESITAATATATTTISSSSSQGSSPNNVLDLQQFNGDRSNDGVASVEQDALSSEGEQPNNLFGGTTMTSTKDTSTTTEITRANNEADATAAQRSAQAEEAPSVATTAADSFQPTPVPAAFQQISTTGPEGTTVRRPTQTEEYVDNGYLYPLQQNDTKTNHNDVPFQPDTAQQSTTATNIFGARSFGAIGTPRLEANDNGVVVANDFQQQQQQQQHSHQELSFPDPHAQRNPASCASSSSAAVAEARDRDFPALPPPTKDTRTRLREMGFAEAKIIVALEKFGTTVAVDDALLEWIESHSDQAIHDKREADVRKRMEVELRDQERKRAREEAARKKEAERQEREQRLAQERQAREKEEQKRREAKLEKRRLLREHEEKERRLAREREERRQKDKLENERMELLDQKLPESKQPQSAKPEAAITTADANQKQSRGSKENVADQQSQKADSLISDLKTTSLAKREPSKQSRAESKATDYGPLSEFLFPTVEAELRAGPWLQEEIDYEKLVEKAFKKGWLSDCSTGTKIHELLAGKLNRDPELIAKRLEAVRSRLEKKPKEKEEETFGPYIKWEEIVDPESKEACEKGTGH